MSASDSIRQQAFAILWDAVNDDVDADDVGNPVDAVSAKDWLEHTGWPILFPGHCFRCHGFEDGPCEAPYGHGPFGCPGCVKADQEHQQKVQAATMEPPSFKLRGLLSLCHDHDDDEACTVACRIKDSE